MKRMFALSLAVVAISMFTSCNNEERLKEGMQAGKEIEVAKNVPAAQLRRTQAAYTRPLVPARTAPAAARTAPEDTEAAPGQNRPTSKQQGQQLQRQQQQESSRGSSYSSSSGSNSSSGSSSGSSMAANQE